MAEPRETVSVEDRWPGLDPKPGEIDLTSKEQLVNILKDLAGALERLEGLEVGSLPDLKRRALLTKPVVMGGWPAGDDFFDATTNAYTYVSHIYESINYKLRAAIQKINDGGGLLVDVDDLNKGRQSV
ncbi:hypothetical protein [Nonomuraea sp. NPDC003804]|uniref:hypothetical protein n=1 Tax=Nonomuraea sp. NPDC003804 TaxID=3154547 RepID=UPI0033B32876